MTEELKTAIGVIESAAGFCDETTPVGEAWQTVLRQLHSGWKPATSPPDGTPGNWTKRVVVITNIGNVLMASYYHQEDGYDSRLSRWQRMSSLLKGEEIAWWIEEPPLP